jgi:hypothetical protein
MAMVLWRIALVLVSAYVAYAMLRAGSSVGAFPGSD